LDAVIAGAPDAAARRFRDGIETGGNTMDTTALILSIIGAINWGLVSLFQFDLVAWICGGQTAFLSRVIYGLVGLAGLWCITLLFRRDRESDRDSQRRTAT